MTRRQRKIKNYLENLKSNKIEVSFVEEKLMFSTLITANIRKKDVIVKGGFHGNMSIIIPITKKTLLIQVQESLWEGLRIKRRNN